MIEKSKTSRGCFYKTRILKELGEDPSVEDALDHILGDTDGTRGTNYVLYCYDERSKRSFLNRINLLWVYPLFILTVPLQYLILGEVGVNRNTKIGRLIDKLIKFE